MTQSFQPSDYLDESNLAVREELLTLTLLSLRWTFRVVSEKPRVGWWSNPDGLESAYVPAIDHNLAAMARGSLTEDDQIVFIFAIRDFIDNEEPRRVKTFDVVSSTPTQQLVACLVAKGILK